MCFPSHTLPTVPNGFKMQKAVFHRIDVKIPHVEQAESASAKMHYNTLFKTCLCYLPGNVKILPN